MILNAFLNVIYVIYEHINWEALGAIATTLAVIVALWQTKVSNMKKAKLVFVESRIIAPTIAMGSLGYMPENEYVGIEFSNVGNRKIIIKNYWIEIPGNIYAIIIPESTPAGPLTWPVELDIEESVFLPWSKDKFLKYVGSENRLMRNKKLTFCVGDTAGKIYKCKTKKVLQKYLEYS